MDGAGGQAVASYSSSAPQSVARGVLPSVGEAVSKFSTVSDALLVDGFAGLAMEAAPRRDRAGRLMSAVRSAVNSVVENLEERRLMAGDTSTVQSLPFSLEFDGPSGGIVDKNGTGTGFTYVQINKNNNE